MYIIYIYTRIYILIDIDIYNLNTRLSVYIHNIYMNKYICIHVYIY